MAKKCTTVTCPECGHSFDVCFIDYGDKRLDRFAQCAQCPKCDARFPVVR